MQLFIRGLDGKTRAIIAEPALPAVLAAAEAATGVQAQHQVLLYQGRMLSTETATGLHPGSTLHMTGRLLGGKPTQVRMLTADSTLPATVTIDVEADTPMEKVKMQLFRATGLPIQLQHVMLGGIGDLVLVDKRSALGVSYCGTASSMYFATLPAAKAPRPETK